MSEHVRLGNKGRGCKTSTTCGHGICSYIEVFKLRDAFVMEIHYLIQGWNVRVPMIETNEAVSEPRAWWLDSWPEHGHITLKPKLVDSEEKKSQGRILTGCTRMRQRMRGLRCIGVSLRSAQFHLLAYFLQRLRGDLESHAGELQFLCH